MRIPKRSVLRDAAGGVGMAALVLVLVPLSLLHDVRSRRRRTGGNREIPRLAATATTIEQLLAGGRPVVVEGLASHIGAPPADLDGLRVMGERQTTASVVEVVDAANPYFLYTGDYGATVLREAELSFGGVLDLVFGNRTDDEVVYQRFGVQGVVGEVIDEFSRAVRSAGGGGTLRNVSGIWVGSAGAVTPLHHDAWPGLLFQTEGRKSVTMFEPGDRGKLYFNFPIPVGSRWSRLPGRSAEADPTRFPHFAAARRHTTILEAGDALFVPPYWAHEMEALTANISIPLRLRGPRRAYLDPGFLRPAAEVLDTKVRAVRRRLAA